MKKSLNPTLVYVLSIIGLLCCCILGSGIFLSGPAFYIANKKVNDAKQNPEDYEGNLEAMSTAKIVALVVLIINIIMIIRVIYILTTSDWDELTRSFNEAMEEFNRQQGN